MPKIRVFDPAMCCSSGVCGPEVDQSLVTFAADVDWVRRAGGDIQRFNLAQQPTAFVADAAVKAFLDRSGQEGLPLILVDGEIALAGRYPSREELARWAKLSPGLRLPVVPQPPPDCKPGSGCCGAV